MYDTGAGAGFFPWGGGVRWHNVTQRCLQRLGDATEGVLGGLPQENFEYEVL